MTPIKRNLLYIFRGSLLRLRISWNHGIMLTVSVGYHVDRTDAKGKQKWDGSRCMRNTTHGEDKIPAATINKALEQLEDKIDKAFFTFESTDRMPSQIQLKALLSDSKIQSKSLGELIGIYRKEQAIIRQWSYKTSRIVKQSLDNLLETFGENASLEGFDNAKVATLINHMTSKNCSYKELDNTVQSGYKNSTTNIYMSHIQSFAKWAVEKEYVRECALTKKMKKLKTAKMPVIYLTIEEINRMRSIKTTIPEKEVMDCFVFCCFTGLRYSDMKNLRWSQIKEDSIEIVTQKTHDLIEIELNDFSRDILNSRQRGKMDDHVFMPPANDYYNKIVKSIAKKADISEPVKTITYIGSLRTEKTFPKWEFITSHTPRKTFVTNALSLGISPSIVMKWTGHKQFEAMQPYIEIVSKAKQKSMQLFNSINADYDKDSAK